jgi:hypothetical protein
MLGSVLLVVLGGGLGVIAWRRLHRTHPDIMLDTALQRAPSCSPRSHFFSRS